MPRTGFVNATWVGPFNGEAVLSDGSSVQVISGETVCEIPEGEAQASAYWEPAAAAPKSKPKPEE